MLSGPDSVNRSPKVPVASAGNWLSELAPNSANAVNSAKFAVNNRHVPLKIAIVALIALVMLGPLMTIVEGSAAGEGSSDRQIGYLLILGLTIYAILPTATPLTAIA